MLSLLEIITEAVSKASSLITLNPVVVCCVNKTSTVTQTSTLESSDRLVNFSKISPIKNVEDTEEGGLYRCGVCCQLCKITHGFAYNSKTV